MRVDWDDRVWVVDSCLRTGQVVSSRFGPGLVDLEDRLYLQVTIKTIVHTTFTLLILYTTFEVSKQLVYSLKKRLSLLPKMFDFFLKG